MSTEVHGPPRSSQRLLPVPGTGEDTAVCDRANEALGVTRASAWKRYGQRRSAGRGALSHDRAVLGHGSRHLPGRPGRGPSATTPGRWSAPAEGRPARRAGPVMGSTPGRPIRHSDGTRPGNSQNSVPLRRVKASCGKALVGPDPASGRQPRQAFRAPVAPVAPAVPPLTPAPPGAVVAGEQADPVLATRTQRRSRSLKPVIQQENRRDDRHEVPYASS